MMFPGPDALAIGDDDVMEGALISAELREAIRMRLGDQSGEGSASRVSRVIILAEPPQMGEGEITAKGNLNFKKIVARRAALLERLYDDNDPAMIWI